MMKYTYTYHRFDSEQDFHAACEQADFPFFEGQPSPKEGCAFDVIGTIRNQGEQVGTSEDGFPIYEMTPLPGFHVNMAWSGDMDPAFEVSQVFPETPNRVWF